MHSNTLSQEKKEYNTRLLYPLSSNPPKMYSFPLMLAPQLPDMEVGSSPSIRCIVLQVSTDVNSGNAAFKSATNEQAQARSLRNF